MHKKRPAKKMSSLWAVGTSIYRKSVIPGCAIVEDEGMARLFQIISKAGDK
jgi:hypothetical protein